MASGSFRFERFCLDPGNRQLRRDDELVELSSRYLDALALLVRERGRLVSKESFLDEVWRGVPVTDEALTQCIRTLRRQLGDDAARPRFIETVPKHGYRFIAPVEQLAARVGSAAAEPRPASPPTPPYSWRQFFLLGAAGTAGGGFAGVLGGLFYGLAGASQAGPGMGGISVLLVLTCVTVLVAATGAAGVASGIAAAGFASNRHWIIAGGAAGGLVVGAIVKLLGVDAFNLLFGRSPGDITGAIEGGLLGAAVGLGAWLAGRGGERLPIRRSMAAAALAGGTAGMAIPLLGGHLMGGSLNLLASHFPGSRLRLDRIGELFGESSFGPVSHVVSGGIEGALFAACIVGAMTLARRRLRRSAGDLAQEGV